MDKAPGGIDLFSWQAKMDAQNPNDPPADLPDATKDDLLCEHTLDWILCNFDTKGENFINQPGGHIVSFDKEASFNHLMKDEAQTMSYTYKPHSNETIYNTIFRAYAQGRIDLNLRANLGTIERMMAMPDQDFLDMFQEALSVKYRNCLFKQDKIREAQRRLLARKNSLLDEYEKFYTELMRERAQHITNPHGELRDSQHPAWKFKFYPDQYQKNDDQSYGASELEEDMEELEEVQTEQQAEQKQRKIPQQARQVAGQRRREKKSRRKKAPQAGQKAAPQADQADTQTAPQGNRRARRQAARNNARPNAAQQRTEQRARRRAEQRRVAQQTSRKAQRKVNRGPNRNNH